MVSATVSDPVKCGIDGYQTRPFATDAAPISFSGGLTREARSPTLPFGDQGSHAPIGIGRSVLGDSQRGQLIVVRGQVANRIRRGGIAGQRERLAAAAAKILIAARTVGAGLLHPRRPSKRVEGGRPLPN